MRRTSARYAGVDGLVVIADHEQVVLRCREEANEPELGRIHVLEFIDAEVAETRLPPESEATISREQVARAHHEVVEVHGAPNAHEVCVGFQDQTGFFGWRSALDVPGREDGLELRRGRACDGRRLEHHASACRAEQRKAVCHDVPTLADIEQDLSRKGVERAHLDRPGGRHGWRQSAFDPA